MQKSMGRKIARMVIKDIINVFFKKNGDITKI